MTQPEMPLGLEQRLILAHSDSGFAALVSRYFHRLGWGVYLGRSGAEVRHLARTLQPALVVLDTDLADESGWLLCKKLTREHPGPRVILVTERVTPELSHFAAFVGASALVLRQDGIAALASEVLGTALPIGS